METSDVEVEKQVTETSVSKPQLEPATGQLAVAAPLAETQSASAESKNFSPEYVKRIQTHLKRTGFYSGAVDGIAGPRTQSAIRHFQSGCVALKDLISISDPMAIQQSSGMAAEAAITKSKRGSDEAVRLIQLRLKDAGYDPGPIDGIHGARTQTALRSLNSGCLMLRDFSPVSTSERTANRNSANSAAMIADDPDGKLRNASSRETVRLLQIRLRDAGFDPGPIDGLLGSRTKSALQKYRASLAEVSALR
ncbi:MAG: peptidoglycan-binding domain-containing protein [Deltaproteobacteria bacterium]